MAFFFGTPGDDKLEDTLASGDSYQGLGGDDTLIANRGDDTLAGGDDFDRADYSLHPDQTGWTFDLSSMTATRTDGGIVETDTLAGIESVAGTSSPDGFVGDANRNVFYGNGGDDHFFLSAGADEYYGGDGTRDRLADDLGFVVVNLGADRSFASLGGSDTFAAFGAFVQSSYAAGSITLSDGTVQLIDSVESFENTSNTNPAVFVGTDADEFFTFGGGGDRVFAAGGNDNISGTRLGSVDDTVDYSRKSDGSINYGPGPGATTGMNIHVRTFLNGEDYEYEFVGYARDRLGGVLEDDALFGINNVVGSYGDDFIQGGQWGNAGFSDDGSLIKGLGGNDTIANAREAWGGIGDDIFRQYLYYDDVNTVILGDNGHFGGILRGEQGNDTFVLRETRDVIVQLFGGDDSDTVRFFDELIPGDAPNTAFVIDLVAGEVQRAVTGLFVTLDSVENAVGGASGDQIFGNGLANRLDGFSGVDLIYGGGGMDTIWGGTGNDSLYGDGDDDTLDGGSGDDHMEGGLGDDVFYVDSTSDVVVEAAGQGNDTIRSTLTNLNLSDFANVENIELSDSNGSFPKSGGTYTVTGNNMENTLAGNSARDKVFGLGANDLLKGAAGNDTLNGGTGRDTMQGGAGNDLIIADRGSDVASGGSGVDTVKASASFQLAGDVEHLKLLGAGNFNGTGNDAKNSIIGNGGNNTLKGANGKDTLKGSGGNDKLFGGKHDDKLVGGGGQDIIVGDQGNDTVSGGGGTDTAVFAGKIGRYKIVKSGSKIKVIDETGNLGTDVLTGVEKLKFGGKVYSAKKALQKAAGDDRAKASSDDGMAVATGDDANQGGIGDLLTGAWSLWSDDLLA